jgi:hypothetical protein
VLRSVCTLTIADPGGLVIAGMMDSPLMKRDRLPGDLLPILLHLIY